MTMPVRRCTALSVKALNHWHESPTKKVAILIAVVFIGLLQSFHAADSPWTLWPAGSQDYDASIQIPPAFKKIPSAVRQSERTMINARVRSPDGTAEFAVTAVYVRNLEQSVKARTIALPLLPGEHIAERTPKERKIKDSEGDYSLYDEDITVQGPKGAYVRYFHLELSTGSRPGASSVLWEFKVVDEHARITYQAAYQQFKEKVNFGED